MAVPTTKPSKVETDDLADRIFLLLVGKMGLDQIETHSDRVELGHNLYSYAFELADGAFRVPDEMACDEDPWAGEIERQLEKND